MVFQVFPRSPEELIVGELSYENAEALILDEHGPQNPSEPPSLHIDDNWQVVYHDEPRHWKPEQHQHQVERPIELCAAPGRVAEQARMLDMLGLPTLPAVQIQVLVEPAYPRRQQL